MDDVEMMDVDIVPSSSGKRNRSNRLESTPIKGIIDRKGIKTKKSELLSVQGLSKSTLKSPTKSCQDKRSNHELKIAMAKAANVSKVSERKVLKAKRKAQPFQPKSSLSSKSGHISDEPRVPDIHVHSVPTVPMTIPSSIESRTVYYQSSPVYSSLAEVRKPIKRPVPASAGTMSTRYRPLTATVSSPLIQSSLAQTPIRSQLIRSPLVQSPVSPPTEIDSTDSEFQFSGDHHSGLQSSGLQFSGFQFSGLQSSGFQSCVKRFYVLDTNILIHHLRGLKTALTRLSNHSSSIRFIIPSIVLQELDSMKDRMKESRIIIHFIHDQFKIKSLLSGDKIFIDTNISKDINIEVYNNDDRIIKTCLEIRESQSRNYANEGILINERNYANEGILITERNYANEETIEANEVVVKLISDDINLRNKAMNHEILAFSWNEIIVELKKMAGEGGGSRDVSNVSRDVSNVSRDVSNVSNEEELVRGKRMKSDTSDSLAPSFHALRSQSPVVTSGGNIPNQSSTYTNQQMAPNQPEIEDDPFKKWITFKYQSEGTLRNFIRYALHQLYDNLWNNIFKINWSTFDLKEALKVLLKGWQGTFSDFFHRSESVKKNIEMISLLLMDESNNYVQLYQLTSELINILPKINSIDDGEDKKKIDPNERQEKNCYQDNLSSSFIVTGMDEG